MARRWVRLWARVRVREACRSHGKAKRRVGVRVMVRVCRAHRKAKL